MRVRLEVAQYDILLPRWHVRSHDFRPALIVDGHGTTQIVIPLSAQVGNFVGGLSDRIAEANEKHRRNTRVQKFRNRLNVLISPVFLR